MRVVFWSLATLHACRTSCLNLASACLLYRSALRVRSMLQPPAAAAHPARQTCAHKACPTWRPSFLSPCACMHQRTWLAAVRVRTPLWGRTLFRKALLSLSGVCSEQCAYGFLRNVSFRAWRPVIRSWLKSCKLYMPGQPGLCIRVFNRKGGSK